MKKALFPAVAFLLATLAGSVILRLLGENPLVLWESFYNSLFTQFGLGYTLFYATPLIFTGLSVAIAFHCGLFNIGAEGQLYFGAIAAVVVGSLFPNLPALIAIPLGILAAFGAGGLWGGIAGFLKARRGSHEVIVTILLNFIAYSIVNYLVLYPLDSPENQAPETVAIGAGFQLPTLHAMSQWFGLNWFDTCPVNSSLLIAILTAWLVNTLLFRTSLGFEMRAVGRNPVASRFNAIRVGDRLFLAMALSGGLAGLVGINEVMGYHHSVIEGFSPGYGFTGIAVALLARNSPLGILVSALLFGLLHNSARELEFLSERVSKELAMVLQAILIALVASHSVLESWMERRRKKHA